MDTMISELNAELDIPRRVEYSNRVICEWDDSTDADIDRAHHIGNPFRSLEGPDEGRVVHVSSNDAFNVLAIHSKLPVS